MRNGKNTTTVWDAIIDERRRVALFDWTEYEARSWDYQMSWGACDREVELAKFDELKLLLNEYGFLLSIGIQNNATENL